MNGDRESAPIEDGESGIGVLKSVGKRNSVLPRYGKGLIRFMSAGTKQQIPQKITGFSGLSKLTENLCCNRGGKCF